jgi:hypothetical protein
MTTLGILLYENDGTFLTPCVQKSKIKDELFMQNVTPQEKGEKRKNTITGAIY